VGFHNSNAYHWEAVELGVPPEGTLPVVGALSPRMFSEGNNGKKAAGG
jgi:hypothetical protein